MLIARQRYILDVLIDTFPPGKDFNSQTFYANLHLAPQNIEFDEVSEICRSLESDGYISGLKLSGTGLVDNLRLEVKGRHYKKFRWQVWKERLIGAGITLTVWGIQKVIVWLCSK